MITLTIQINHTKSDEVISALKQIGVSPRRLVWPHVLKADYSGTLTAGEIIRAVEAIQHVRKATA